MNPPAGHGKFYRLALNSGLRVSARRLTFSWELQPGGNYLCSGSSTQGGVASIKRPNSGSSELIFCFISQAILR
jgi:hypothetical protein